MKNIGLNGAGFFENLTDDALNAFTELVPAGTNITLRLPGGSITRFTDPADDFARGWGMTVESVNAYYDRFGDIAKPDEDDPGESRQSWLDKVAAQPTHRYIDRLLEFIDIMRDIQVSVNVIWVSNIINSNIDSQFNVIAWLLDNGVNITAIEMGNEVYGKYDFDVTQYIADYIALRRKVLMYYPGTAFSLVSGNFSGRKEHDNWNAALKASGVPYEFVTIHYYITEDKCPEPFALLPKGKITIDYATGNAQLQAATDSFVNKILADDAEQFFIAEINKAAAFYEKPILITEFNTKPSGAFGNMLVNGMWIMKQLINCPESVHTICLHNGIAPDLHGCITKTQPQDDAIGLDMVKRIGFYATYFAIKNINALNSDYIFAQPVYNTGNEFVPVNLNIIPDGFAVVDRVYQFVIGDYLYSSAGVLGCMTKKQSKTYEIDEVYENIYTPEESIDSYPKSFGIVLTYTQDADIIPEEDDDDDDINIPKPKSNFIKSIIAWLRKRYHVNTVYSYK